MVEGLQKVHKLSHQFQLALLIDRDVEKAGEIQLQCIDVHARVLRDAMAE